MSHSPVIVLFIQLPERKPSLPDSEKQRRPSLIIPEEVKILTKLIPEPPNTKTPTFTRSLLLGYYVIHRFHNF